MAKIIKDQKRCKNIGLSRRPLKTENLSFNEKTSQLRHFGKYLRANHTRLGALV
jgi:hypothetical protein